MPEKVTRRTAATEAAVGPEERPAATGLSAAMLERLASAPGCAPAAVASRLRGASNAALARQLAPGATVVQREEEPDDPGPTALDQGGTPGTAPPTAASSGGRPAPSVNVRQCADCNAAVAMLTAADHLGEAYVQATWKGIGEIQVAKGKSGYTASIGIEWTIDVAGSSMEITDFSWPDMSAEDRAAVTAYRSALEAHEEGHFKAVEAAIARLPKTIRATGGSEAAAASALQAKVPTEVANGQAAIDAATKAYDARTKHGKTQSAVGGANVQLNCPPPKPAP